MNREHHDQFAERWLDEALARYSDAKPRDGLEGRILANLASQRQHRVSTWRRFVWIPVACTALVAMIAGLNLFRPATKTQPVVAPVVAVSKPAQQEVPRVNSANVGHPTIAKRPRVRASQPVVAKASEPRKPQFPSTQLSPNDERLLVAYVAATPQEELKKIAAEQRDWQERVARGAKATEQRDTEPPPDINELHSPLESGRTDTGAYGAR